MPLRRVQFPQDWRQFGQVIGDSFQYPENESWSVQADEREEFIAMSRNLRRIWPVIRMAQAIAPVLKDIIDGVVWEENGKIVGTTFIQRLGSTSTWYIMAVGVLPEYRRRGLARQLMQAAFELIRNLGGEQVILNVIEGNLPAVRLYEEFGMEVYDGSYEFVLDNNQPIGKTHWPSGYVLEEQNFFDWEPRYKFEKRITPQKVAEYDAIQPQRYKQPGIVRLIMPLIQWSQGIRRLGFSVTTTDGDVAANFGLMVPQRGNRPGRIRSRLDPAHSHLAPHIIGWCQQRLGQTRPGGKVESGVPRWMESMVEAHRDAGFETKYSYLSMGIKLKG